MSLATHSAGDLVMCLCDLCAGRHIHVFDGVHAGYGVGQRNLEGGRLLVLSGEGIMHQIHGLRERKRGR